jgi:diguanylate cyclase (GGDEF)-like protein
MDFIGHRFRSESWFGSRFAPKVFRRRFDSMTSKGSKENGKKIDKIVNEAARGTMLDEICRADISELLGISGTLCGVMRLDELLRSIVDLAVKRTDAERGFLIMVSKEQELKIAYGVIKPGVEVPDCSMEDSLLDREQVLYISDAGQLKSNLMNALSGDKQERTVLCVPIRTRGTSYGVLYVDHGGSNSLFNDSDQQFLESLADLAAIGIDNSILYELAFVDGTTELFNRSYFDRRLGEEIERSLRHNKPFSLVVLDINCLKRINDSFGYKQGTKVLYKLAKILKERIRPYDTLCRYGDDEFAVILPGATEREAHSICHRLERTLKESLLYLGYYGKPLSVSFGIAVFPEHASTRQNLLDAVYQDLKAQKATRKVFKSIES